MLLFALVYGTASHYHSRNSSEPLFHGPGLVKQTLTRGEFQCIPSRLGSFGDWRPTSRCHGHKGLFSLRCPTSLPTPAWTLKSANPTPLPLNLTTLTVTIQSDLSGYHDTCTHIIADCLESVCSWGEVCHVGMSDYLSRNNGWYSGLMQHKRGI